MAIIKRGTNYYLIRYELDRGPDGKRRQKCEAVKGNKAKAVEILAERVTQLRQGTYVVPNNIKLGQWINKWLVSVRPEVSPKTYERYSQLSQVHIIPQIGHIPLQKVVIPDIREFYVRLFNEGLTTAKRSRLIKMNKPTASEHGEVEGLSKCTIRHVHRVLSMSLSKAVLDNQLYKNPLKDMKFPKFSSNQSDEDTEDVKAFTRSQLNELLSKMRGTPLHMICSFAVGTGMRQGEIIALRWSQIDFDSAKVEVLRSMEHSSNGLRVKSTKNSKSRKIDLSQTLLRQLKEHRKNQIETALSFGVRFPSNGFVFPLSPFEPTIPLSRFWLSNNVTRIANSIGCSGLTFHNLRHTYASLCLTADPVVPLTAVSKYLGHSSPAITASIYSHFICDTDDRAKKAVDGFLAGSFDL